VLLEEIVAKGNYKLATNFHDNFKASTNNNSESIFEVQYSVNDGAPGGENGNIGSTLNYPYGGGGITTCCGFFQPSQNLVNAFQTDADGLPLLTDFNNEDVTNDMGIDAYSEWKSGTAYKKDQYASITVNNIETAYKALSDNTGQKPSDFPAVWKQVFTESDANLDPRLDWTVGRRGIPYLDWGVHPGRTYVRDQAYAGPYSPMKHVMNRADIGSATFVGNPRLNANNYRMIRLSHVLLWLAEIAVAPGATQDLEAARGYVNLIRARAANPIGWVKNADGTPAANYVIGEYTVPFASADEATRAVQFEERLEFAMEGHRRFDLVRWGIADQTLNAYYLVEGTKRGYLDKVKFIPNKHEYFPIPLQEILNSQIGGQVTLTQNPGYN